MDRIVYTALAGANRTLENQASISHNMANSTTTGFRAQMAMYRSVPLVGDGLDTRVSTVTATPTSDFSLGPMQTTERALDVALTGPGWLTVQTPDGQEAYTRAGNLQVGVNGLLQTSLGLPLLTAQNQPIAVPENARLTFGADGSVNALGAGDPPNDLMLLGQLKLVNPATNEIVRGDDGLFRRFENGQAVATQADPNVRIVGGVLEGSNVNPAQTMVGMIDSQRRFEMQMKVISTANENAQRANGLLAAG